MRNYKPKVGSKKKKYLNFSEDVLARAVTAVERGASYREVECKFGVPKSTVHRRIKRINNKPMGGQTALSREEEQSLVHHLIVVSEWGFPFSNLDLRLLVKGYLERTSRKVKCFNTFATRQILLNSWWYQTSISYPMSFFSRNIMVYVFYSP